MLPWNRPELTLSGHFWTSLQHFNDIYRYVAPMQVPDFSAKSGKTAQVVLNHVQFGTRSFLIRDLG
jgi:hypothetical protein